MYSSITSVLSVGVSREISNRLALRVVGELGLARGAAHGGLTVGTS